VGEKEAKKIGKNFNIILGIGVWLEAGFGKMDYLVCDF
jgi:hypothetical protein